MVAPSYQSLIQLGDPFTLNGKQYVNVQLKSGKTKSVRYYTKSEYVKVYGKTKAAEEPNPYYKPQKDLLGFINGYITIFGEEGFNEENEYLKYDCRFRYAVPWGWYLPSDTELPEDLPEDLTPIKLPWTAVGGCNGKLYSAERVKESVQSVLYPEVKGNYVGEIGERLDLTLYVTRAIPLEGNYGISTMHIMEDQDGNTYIWTTASRNWAAGTFHTLRGTVKDHKTYSGVAQTVLTRCSER